ncbi:MAG: GNAT family N-acetyltransferase [Rectinemataceae bacterium]
MFELSETALERVIFAMEDQSGTFFIDMTSGEVVRIPENGSAGAPADAPDTLNAAGATGVAGAGNVGNAALADDVESRGVDLPENLSKPPAWNSRDGFRLMEQFLAGVRNPALRRELGAALVRGKGVFKAFKEALAAWPEAEKAFRDFKTKAMRIRIDTWMDDWREAEGFERLNPPPEDNSDLTVSEFDVNLATLSHAPPGLADMVAEASLEALDLLPAASVRETESLNAILRNAAAGHCAFVEDEEGGLLAASFGVYEESAGRAYGRIRFLYAKPGFRRMGLGESLLNALRGAFLENGIRHVVIDSVFVPPEYAETLAVRGYRHLGVRMVAPLPD